ncbi:hypothetical protein Plhal703r1_c45g0146291 [Plasmopara halstedii]
MDTPDCTDTPDCIDACISASALVGRIAQLKVAMYYLITRLYYSPD